MTKFMLKYFTHLFIEAQNVFILFDIREKEAIPYNRLQRPTGL
jgi:hypothetical protein